MRNSVPDARSSQTLDWHGSHNLTFGGQFIRTTLKDQNPDTQAHLLEVQRYDERLSLDEWALYAEDEWPLRDDFKLTPGLRFSHHDLYGGHVTPRIHGVRDATPFHTRFRDRLLQEVTGELWTDGPQHTAADGNQHDYIIYRNFNVDKAGISGVELTGDRAISDRLTTRAGYTHTRSRQKSGDYAGFPLTRTRRHMASLRLDWQTPVEGLANWPGPNYHWSEINSGLCIGASGIPAVINGVTGYKYAACRTVDPGANCRLSDRATLGAAVHNVFNEEVRQDEFRNVMEGRRLWSGLTASF